MEWNQGCAAARRAGVLPLQAAAAAMCGIGGPWPCSCEALIPVPVWPTGLWLSLEFLGGGVYCSAPLGTFACLSLLLGV